jgi:hypothetical protein
MIGRVDLRATRAEPIRTAEDAPGTHDSVWSSDEDLLRAISELGTDPQIRAIIERHAAGRRAAIRREASRLAAAGALRGEVSARAAVGVIWFLTSFETYDFMRRPGRSRDRILARDARLLDPGVAH